MGIIKTIPANFTTTPIISSGSGAPTSTPSKIGDIYVDTAIATHPVYYMANGTASSANWINQNAISNIHIACAFRSGVADNAVYNAGGYYAKDPIVTGNGESLVKIYVPKAGIIKSCKLIMGGDPSASAETSNFFISVNNTTENLIFSTVQHNGYQKEYSATNLNIAVADGAFLWTRCICPAFATNPPGIIWVADIVIEH
jgi:hypothetical protein